MNEGTFVFCGLITTLGSSGALSLNPGACQGWESGRADGLHGRYQTLRTVVEMQLHCDVAARKQLKPPEFGVMHWGTGFTTVSNYLWPLGGASEEKAAECVHKNALLRGWIRILLCLPICGIPVSDCLICLLFVNHLQESIVQIKSLTFHQACTWPEQISNKSEQLAEL